MNKSDYDKYYKKGGTYVIPVELFNELLDELEELKKNQRLTQEKRDHLHLELDEMVESLQNQLQQKENIIKEVREKLHICSIGKNCRGKSKTAGGFIWKFKEVK